MDLLIIGLIALAACIFLMLPSRVRAERRQEMGLGPLPPSSREPEWNWPPREHSQIARASHVNDPAAPERPGSDPRR